MIVVAEGYARALRRDLREQPDHELSKGSANTTTSGRPEFQDLANAAEFLHWQLRQTGCLISGEKRNKICYFSLPQYHMTYFPSGKKIVREPFSRDIRGAAPNNLDVYLSQVMARKVRKMVAEGATEAMPSVAGGMVGQVAFSELRTCNSCDPQVLELADNLQGFEY